MVFQCLCLLILCALCSQAHVGNSAVLQRIRSSGRLRSRGFVDSMIENPNSGKSPVAQSRVPLGYATLVDEVRFHTWTKRSKCPKKSTKKQTILDRVLWLKQGFSRLTRGCVCLGWEGRGRTRPPPLSSRYGSVRGAVSGYGISRWSPSTLHVVVVHAHITA